MYGIGTGGWIYPGKGDKAEFEAKIKGLLKPDDWNHFKVRAEGARIQTWLNGEPVADVEHKQILKGYFGIQHHGKGGTVKFRNIRARPLKTPTAGRPNILWITAEDMSPTLGCYGDSLGRSDDLVRGVYRLRLDVEQATEFSRFVIFQVGADTYNSTAERKMAIGSEGGIAKEWETQWGGNTYRTDPVRLDGRIPWVSLHEGVSRDDQKPGAIANRGIVIREWKARLGGKDAAPWGAERGLSRGRSDSSTFDLVPPPGVTKLEPGDFVEATIEHVIVPQFAKDYYGPNEALRSALAKDQNTWRMIEREAVQGERTVEVTTGKLLRRFPDVRVRAEGEGAKLSLHGGLGYVPITITGLGSSSGYELRADGKPVDQSVHGKDFWQCDFDPVSRSWSRTYNVRFPAGAKAAIELRRVSP